MRLVTQLIMGSPLARQSQGDDRVRRSAGGGRPSPTTLVFEEGRLEEGLSMFMRAPKRAGEAPMKGTAFRESEANFRPLAETIASAIFISRGGRLHYVNHAAEIITGYAREELLTMNFWDLVPPGTRDPVINRGWVHREVNGIASGGEMRILTKNHEERWLDITAATLEFDGVPGTLILSFDHTQLKQVEAQAHLLAITDPLTGLGNYRRLLDVLHAEIE